MSYQHLTTNREIKIYIHGYASTFLEDKDKEVIVKGAFCKSLEYYKNNKLKLLWQHDVECPIGLVTFMEEDQYGLFINAQLTQDTQKAREASALVKNKIVDSLSIGFIPVKVRNDKDGRKHILEAKLHEVSLVTFPANKFAKVTNIIEINKKI